MKDVDDSNTNFHFRHHSRPLISLHFFLRDFQTLVEMGQQLVAEFVIENAGKKECQVAQVLNNWQLKRSIIPEFHQKRADGGVHL